VIFVRIFADIATPAQAGAQNDQHDFWLPVFTGMTSLDS